MVSHNVPQSYQGVQLRLVEVVECDPPRLRVGFIDLDGGLHFAILEFMPSDEAGFWEWTVVNEHVVQLPLAVLE